MSLLPASNVILDQNVTDKQVAAIEKRIKIIPGVMSVHFNKKAKAFLVNGVGAVRVGKSLKGVKGVSSVRNQL